MSTIVDRQSEPGREHGDLRMAVLVGLFITIVWIALTWTYGLDLADEGYYWYGSQRLLRGEIPMRDFLSYDIGRYAWSALFMWLLRDDGVIGARMSVAVFQAGTIVVGVVLAVRAVEGRLRTPGKWAFALLAALLLNIWVHPYYKAFDYGTSILILAMLFFMLDKQSTRTWFGAGCILGLAAIIGRNHGVYGAFAALLLLVFLIAKHERPRVLLLPALAFVGGVIAGFSPTFILALTVDGFGASFMTTLRDLLQSGSANIGLPIPWPWTVVKNSQGWLVWVMNVTVGIAFISLTLVPVIACLVMLRRPLAAFRAVDRVVLSAALCGLGYAHYAYSRADLTHLTHSIVGVVFILLCFGLQIRRPLTVALVLVLGSVIALAQETPYFAHALLNKKLNVVNINGIDLKMFQEDGNRISAAEQIFDAYPEGRGRFLALPNAPGLYAISKSKMPVWEIYALSKRPATFELKELERLQAMPPKLVLLSDHALDIRDDQRFSQMHPLTYEWILTHYRRVPALAGTPDASWQAYVPRQIPQP